jgi:hypothetical protein
VGCEKRTRSTSGPFSCGRTVPIDDIGTVLGWKGAGLKAAVLTQSRRGAKSQGGIGLTPIGRGQRTKDREQSVISHSVASPLAVPGLGLCDIALEVAGEAETSRNGAK